MTKISNINSFAMSDSSGTRILYHDSEVLVNQSSGNIFKLLNHDWKVKCDAKPMPEFIQLTIVGETEKQAFNVYDIEYYFPSYGNPDGGTTIHFKGGWYPSIDVLEHYRDITTLINNGQPSCRTWIVC